VTAELGLSRSDEDLFAVLKTGGAIGIFTLFGYVVIETQVRGPRAPGIFAAWYLLGVVCLFFGVAWTRWFRLFWKGWALALALVVNAVFGHIGWVAHDAESAFIAAALTPIATASFVAWGPWWQLALNVGGLIAYGAFNSASVDPSTRAYHWLGVIASMAYAQYTAGFLDRYRTRVRRQVEDLEEASRFRESQIATMAHDIRSPVAALGGYVALLEDPQIAPRERTDLLERIGATAWNMDLVVANVLDFYRIQDGPILANPVQIDPTALLADVVDNCAQQGRRKNLAIISEVGPIPECRIDPRHLERVLKNLAANAMSRMTRGEASLRVGADAGAINVEISDCGISPDAQTLARIFERPDREGHAAPGSELGLYITRAMVDAAGGTIAARAKSGGGLTISVSIPIGRQTGSGS
jgi:signal transduction histidine kinase